MVIRTTVSNPGNAVELSESRSNWTGKFHPIWKIDSAKNSLHYLLLDQLSFIRVLTHQSEIRRCPRPCAADEALRRSYVTWSRLQLSHSRVKTILSFQSGNYLTTGITKKIERLSAKGTLERRVTEYIHVYSFLHRPPWTHFEIYMRLFNQYSPYEVN